MKKRGAEEERKELEEKEAILKLVLDVGNLTSFFDSFKGKNNVFELKTKEHVSFIKELIRYSSIFTLEEREEKELETLYENECIENSFSSPRHDNFEEMELFQDEQKQKLLDEILFSIDKKNKKTLIIGNYYKQKIKDEEPIQMMIINDNGIYKNLIFLNQTFEKILCEILIGRKEESWRMKVTRLGQIPPSLYQAIRKTGISNTRVFPLLDNKREQERHCIYPNELFNVVNVLRYVTYEESVEEDVQQRKQENNESNMMEWENTSDISNLSSLLGLNNKKKEEIEEEKEKVEEEKVMVLHPILNVLYKTRYDKYATSATIFAIALSIVNDSDEKEKRRKQLEEYEKDIEKSKSKSERKTKEDLYRQKEKELENESLLKTFLRLGQFLMREGKEVPTEKERIVIEELTLALATSIENKYQHILSFFKNIKSLLKTQLKKGIVKKKVIKQGKFLKYEGPYTLKDLEKRNYKIEGAIINRFMIENKETDTEIIHFLYFNSENEEEKDLISVHYTMNILLKRFEDTKTMKKNEKKEGILLFEQKKKKDYAIYYDAERAKIVVLITKRFHGDLIKYYMPYLCTCSTFIERPHIPSLLYPIHVNNYFHGGRKGLVYSMKSLLRFFCKGTLNNFGNQMATEDDVNLVYFYSLLSPILDNIYNNSKEKNADPQTIVCDLKNPFESLRFLLFKEKKFEDKVQHVLSGFSTESHSSLYSGIKSFAFIKAPHEINYQVLVKIYDLFKYNIPLQHKWNRLFVLILKMLKEVEDNKAKVPRDFANVKIPETFYHPDQVKFPPHLLFYLFIANEKEELSSFMACAIFISMSAIYPKTYRKVKNTFPTPHPGIEKMENSIERYNNFSDLLYYSFLKNKGANAEQIPFFKRDEKIAQSRNGFALTILFEYLEQQSFSKKQKNYDDFYTYRDGDDSEKEEKEEEEEEEEEEKKKEKDKQLFDRWYPLYYDSVLSQKTSPQVPIYFEENKSNNPVLFKHVFPSWESYFKSTSPKGGIHLKNIIETNDNNENAKITPLAGSHPKFFTFILLYPFDGIIKSYQFKVIKKKEKKTK
jgi:hypothetical protein